MHAEITRLKRRRDDLLHRATIRQERPGIMAEVRRLTQRIHDLEGRRKREAVAAERSE